MLDINKSYIDSWLGLLMERPDKDKYYLKIALEIAMRGTCLRRNFGAVVVNRDQIVSTGYCGSPRHTPNCTDIGKCYREEQGIPAGENYELCRSVHAEMNAIIHAARQDLIGGTMYIAGMDAKTSKVADTMPCKLCRRFIINSGIRKVVVAKTDMVGSTSYYPDDWVEISNKSPFEELDKKGY